jgi:hypothetical protein
VPGVHSVPTSPVTNGHPQPTPPVGASAPVRAAPPERSARVQCNYANLPVSARVYFPSLSVGRVDRLIGTATSGERQERAAVGAVAPKAKKKKIVHSQN